MKLGGVSAEEAALALVEAFGYRSGVNVAALRESTREPPQPMELDWEDAEAVTPVVFVGGYREPAREAPPTLVDVEPAFLQVEPPLWRTSLSRALFELLLLS